MCGCGSTSSRPIPAADGAATLSPNCLHRLQVALNIRNPEADRLAGEVAALSGETKTEAVIQALQERLSRLRSRETESTRQLRGRLDAIALQNAQLPRLDRRSAEEILGYDEHGLPS